MVSKLQNSLNMAGEEFLEATTSLDQSVCFISRNFILQYKHYDIVCWHLALYILIKSFKFIVN